MKNLLFYLPRSIAILLELKTAAPTSCLTSSGIYKLPDAPQEHWLQYRSKGVEDAFHNMVSKTL